MGYPLSLAILSYEPNRKLNGAVKAGSVEFAVCLMTLERTGTDCLRKFSEACTAERGILLLWINVIVAGSRFFADRVLTRMFRSAGM